MKRPEWVFIVVLFVAAAPIAQGCAGPARDQTTTTSSNPKPQTAATTTTTTTTRTYEKQLDTVLGAPRTRSERSSCSRSA